MAHYVESCINLISVISSTITTLGGFYLVRGVLLSSPKEIAALSSTYFDSNPLMQEALASQKAETVVGFAITLLGSAIGFISLFVSYSFTYNLFSVFGFIVLLSLTIYLSNRLIRAIKMRNIHQSSLILFGEYVKSALDSSTFQKIAETSDLLNMPVKYVHGSDPYAFIKKCVINLGDKDLLRLLETKNSSQS